MEVYEIKQAKSKIKYAKISAMHSLDEMYEGAEEICDLGHLEKAKLTKADKLRNEIMKKLAEFDDLINK